MSAAPHGANAAGFGSLQTFLDIKEEDALPPQLFNNHNRRSRKEAGLSQPGIPLPVRPQQQREGGPRDGTVLNRKVAFKMLRQLGCEVQRPQAELQEKGGATAESDPYIEVSLADQPVLFQMLVDWGYKPFRSPHGLQVVHVTDSRKSRTQEEVTKDLSAPRPPPLPRLSETNEGWPVMGARPTMRPDEEQELVKRLAAPRQPKAQEPAQALQEPAKFRSASEQKAHLERLLKPRVAAEELDPTSAPTAPSASVRHAASCGGLPPRPRGSQSLWPSSPSERRTPDGLSSSKASRASPLHAAGTPPGASGRSSSCSGGSSSSGSLPMRPSPRLAQAGARAVRGLAAAPATAGTAAARPPALEEAVASDTAEEAPQRPTPTAGSRRNRPESGEDTLEWIEKLMGPTSWPGRPGATRTKAEQQERLERLAKPRAQSEPPPEEGTRPGASRSPRSQREACSRLAEPRRRPVRREEGEACEAGGDNAAGEEAEGCVDAEEGHGEAVAGAGHGDGQQVVLIPSLLTQMQGQLEPIAEDAPDTRAAGGRAGSKPHRKPRCQSVPAIAAPYAVPVMPPPPVRIGGGYAGARHEHMRPPRRAEPALGPENDSMEDELGSFIAQALGGGPEDGAMPADGEPMLASIDRLYSQLMGSRGPSSSFERTLAPGYPSSSDGQASWPERAAAAAVPVVGDGGLSSSAGSAQASLPRAAAAGPRQQPASAGAPAREPRRRGASAPCSRTAVVAGAARAVASEEGSEALLADIDRLYGEMLHGGGPGIAAFPAAVQAVPASASSASVSAASAAQPAEGGVGSIAQMDASSSGGESPASWHEVREVLEEVLWSALLTGRGAGGRLDMQVKLLELLPPDTLAQCLRSMGRRGLPPSLLHRLQVELPKVHEALAQPPSGAPLAAAAAAELAQTLRQARDGLLALACSEVSAHDLAASAAPPPTCERAPEADVISVASSSNLQASQPKRAKPRRTSMSYWTPESFESLDAPKFVGSKRLNSKS